MRGERVDARNLAQSRDRAESLMSCRRLKPTPRPPSSVNLIRLVQKDLSSSRLKPAPTMIACC